MANYEFVPDRSSPAMGMHVYALGLRQTTLDSGPQAELVKVSQASRRGLYMAAEAGYAQDEPGIRALRLWQADGEDGEPAPLDVAMKRRGQRLAHTFLASLRNSGELAVTACMGFYDDYQYVRIPEPRRCYSPRRVVPEAEINLANSHHREFRDLVQEHLRRTVGRGLDLAGSLDAYRVDLPLITLLQALPEATTATAETQY